MNFAQQRAEHYRVKPEQRTAGRQEMKRTSAPIGKNSKPANAPDFVQDVLNDLEIAFENKDFSLLLQCLGTFDSEGLRGPPQARLKPNDYRVICAAKYEEAVELKQKLMDEMSLRDMMVGSIQALEDHAATKPIAPAGDSPNSKPWQEKKKVKEMEQYELTRLQLLKNLDGAIAQAVEAGMTDEEIEAARQCLAENIPEVKVKVVWGIGEKVEGLEFDSSPNGTDLVVASVVPGSKADGVVIPGFRLLRINSSELSQLDFTASVILLQSQMANLLSHTTLHFVGKPTPGSQERWAREQEQELLKHKGDGVSHTIGSMVAGAAESVVRAVEKEVQLIEEVVEREEKQVLNSIHSSTYAHHTEKKLEWWQQPDQIRNIARGNSPGPEPEHVTVNVTVVYLQQHRAVNSATHAPLTLELQLPRRAEDVIGELRDLLHITPTARLYLSSDHKNDPKAEGVQFSQGAVVPQDKRWLVLMVTNTAPTT